MTENIIIKHRHFLTCNGNVRLRYVLPSVAICLGFLWGGMVSYSSPSNALNHDISANEYETRFVPSAGNSVSASKNIAASSYDPEQAGNGIDPYLTRIGQRPYFDRAYVWTQNIEVFAGDTLGILMEKTGLKGKDYVSAMEAIKDHVDPQAIRPGHQIKVSSIRLGNENTLEEIAYVQNSLTQIVLSQDENDVWVAEKKGTPC